MNTKTDSPVDAAILARLLETQTAVLDALFHANEPTDAVLRHHHVTPQQFARWMNDLDFNQRLQTRCRILSRTREFQIQLGAERAAQVLRDVCLGTAEPKALVHKACLDLIKLARDLDARSRLARQRRHPRERDRVLAKRSTKSAASFSDQLDPNVARDLASEIE